ncbi:MAG: hypothetical protein H8D37_00490 [Chloroflexi bacterium]|nr:hypothetical protein [Chloroflexota bacterium]
MNSGFEMGCKNREGKRRKLISDDFFSKFFFGFGLAFQHGQPFTFQDSDSRGKTASAFKPGRKPEQLLATVGIIRKREHLGSPIAGMFRFAVRCQQMLPDALEMKGSTAVCPSRRSGSSF